MKTGKKQPLLTKPRVLCPTCWKKRKRGGKKPPTKRINVMRSGAPRGGHSGSLTSQIIRGRVGRAWAGGEGPPERGNSSREKKLEEYKIRRDGGGGWGELWSLKSLRRKAGGKTPNKFPGIVKSFWFLGVARATFLSLTLGGEKAQHSLKERVPRTLQPKDTQQTRESEVPSQNIRRRDVGTRGRGPNLTNSLGIKSSKKGVGERVKENPSTGCEPSHPK